MTKNSLIPIILTLNAALLVINAALAQHLLLIMLYLESVLLEFFVIYLFITYFVNRFDFVQSSFNCLTSFLVLPSQFPFFFIFLNSSQNLQCSFKSSPAHQVFQFLSIFVPHRDVWRSCCIRKEFYRIFGQQIKRESLKFSAPFAQLFGCERSSKKGLVNFTAPPPRV